MTVEWADPPPQTPRVGGGKNAQKWLRIAAELRANPGKWALVDETTRSSQGHGLAHQQWPPRRVPPGRNIRERHTETARVRPCAVRRVRPLHRRTVMTAAHGYSAYSSGRCRCDTVCKPAARDYRRTQRQARLAKLAASPVGHGKRAAYDAGCRCGECKDVRKTIYDERERTT